jgi:hypothetical protein
VSGLLPYLIIREKGTSNNMKAELGVRQVGFFISMFIVEDNGFYYKNKRYDWSDVIAIKRNDDLLAKMLRFPSTTILLRDGVVIIIPATLKERKSKTKNGSSHRHSKMEYNEFKNLLQNKSLHRSNGRFSTHLFSANYVMLYRWLIAMSIIFASFILFALFVLNVKLERIVWLLYFQITWMAIGAFMLVRRRLKESIISKELNKHEKHL